MTKNASGDEGSGEGRDFMYTSRSTGNRYTSHITNCYCTLARFYKAFKILFVIKFSSYPPTYHCHPLVSDSCRKFCARGGPSNFERSVDLRATLFPHRHSRFTGKFHLISSSRFHGRMDSRLKSLQFRRDTFVKLASPDRKISQREF